MGTTFVTLTREVSDKTTGFWMQDTMLELWLRLLALHLPEPANDGEDSAEYKIRNQWLLGSRGYFTGHVPHGLAKATQEERGVVRIAIDSLLTALSKSKAPLDADTLNLLGIEGWQFKESIERIWLEEIGHAFIDLLDGKITNLISSTEVMPGSMPYKSTLTNSKD